MPPDLRCLVNGKPFSVVDVGDRGFNYGDGIFETIAIHGGQPLLWDAHMRRFTRGATRLNIKAPNVSVLAQEAAILCEGTNRGILKVVLTRGRGGHGYAPIAHTEPTRILRCLPAPEYPVSHWREGVRVRVCRFRLARDPQLAGIKHLNRLPQVMARAEWEHDYDEGLMLDDGGTVIEGTKCNVFMVRRGALHTPDLEHAGVCGVAREYVLERASAIGVRVAVEPLSLDTIRAADELFLTNSLIGIWPVRQLESKTYPVGPVTQTIQKAIVDAFPVLRDI